MITQPILSTWMIILNGQYTLHDVTIWCKCIKSKIYKEATIKLGKRRFSIFVSWGEDAIINFIIFNISQSFIFIHKYGIIHLDNPLTASYSISDDIKLFGEIYFVDILYDFLKNNDDKNFAVMGAYRVKSMFGVNKFFNCTNLIYFKSILNKIINSHYISMENKKKLKEEFLTFFL